MPWRGKPLSDRAKINVGRWACLAVSLIGLIVAPSLQSAPEGLWQLIRKFSGFYNIPLIAIVLAALFLPRATSKTALGVVLFHIPVYTVITFFWDSGIHFIHWYGILFVLEFGALALFTSPHAQTTPTINHRWISRPGAIAGGSWGSYGSASLPCMCCCHRSALPLSDC